MAIAGQVLPGAEVMGQRFKSALGRLRTVHESSYDQHIDDLWRLVREGMSAPRSSRGPGVATSRPNNSYSAIERWFIGAIRRHFLVADGIDGALARATGRASAFAALVDRRSDHVREITVVSGMACWRELAIGPAIAYGPIYTGLNLTLYLANVQGVPVSWAVKSSLVVYPALFLSLWFGPNMLTPAVLLSEVFMLAAIGIDLRNLARATCGPATDAAEPGPRGSGGS